MPGKKLTLLKKGKIMAARIMEGFHCFNPASGCDQRNIVLPIWEYGHNEEGGYSITGGFIYRGEEIPDIYGKYVYGDFVTGNLWALEIRGGSVTNRVLLLTNYAISTFRN